MDDLQLAWPFLIPIVGTICTFAYVIILTLSKARVRSSSSDTAAGGRPWSWRQTLATIR